MSLTQHDIDALKHEWEEVVGEAESFFQGVWSAISKAAKTDPSVKYKTDVSASLISNEDLKEVVPSIADLSRSSPSKSLKLQSPLHS